MKKIISLLSALAIFSSMAAINSEAAAIMAEINRLYSTAEYNNVSLFNREAYELSAEHKALTET